MNIGAVQDLVGHLVQQALIEIKSATLFNVRHSDVDWVTRIGLLADLVDHATSDLLTKPEQTLDFIAMRVHYRWQYDWLVTQTADYLRNTCTRPAQAVWVWHDDTNSCTASSAAFERF